MKVLILASAKSSPKPFLDKLKDWKIDAAVEKLPFPPEFNKQKGRDELKSTSLQAYADYVKGKHGDTVDVVHLFLSKQDFDYGGGLRGIAYFKTYNGYHFGVYKERSKWFETARHELGHHFDNLVYIYRGIRLETVLGIKDWDDQIIHRRKKRGLGYDYDFDAEYWQVKGHIDAAIQARRRQSGILDAALAKVRELLASQPPEVITEASEKAAPASPPAVPAISNRQKLYNVGYGCLGIDMAPTQNELGCAEALSFVMMKAGMKGLPKTGIPGTWTLNEWLRKNLTIIEEKDALPGDIIISPTGLGNGKVPNGHVGILGKYSIMSNNSGKSVNYGKPFVWDYHLKLTQWKEHFGKKGGYPVLFYRWQ